MWGTYYVMLPNGYAFKLYSWKASSGWEGDNDVSDWTVNRGGASVCEQNAFYKLYKSS